MARSFVCGWSRGMARIFVCGCSRGRRFEARQLSHVFHDGIVDDAEHLVFVAATGSKGMARSFQAQEGVADKPQHVVFRNNALLRHCECGYGNMVVRTRSENPT